LKRFLRNKKCNKLSKHKQVSQTNLCKIKKVKIAMKRQSGNFFLKFLPAFFLLSMPTLGLAFEFKSVAVPQAILYDAPSQSANKVFLLSQFYPVEIIVNLGDWLKVRDAEGGIFWMEAKNLSKQRMLMVTADHAAIHQLPQENSPIIANVESHVTVELIDENPTAGWLKVKHLQGATGYISQTLVWGFQ